MAVGALLCGLCFSCGSSSSPSAASTPPATTTTTATTTSTAVTACPSNDLTLSLGATTPVAGGSGQYQLPLIFTNNGSTPCTLRGYPKAELHGPSDPNGPVYQLPEAPAAVTTVTLTVGGTAEATLTYLKAENGDVGSMGSTHWVPTTVVITPPGSTGQLTASWPSHDPVLRQDEATHPGSYVGPVQAA